MTGWKTWTGAAIIAVAAGAEALGRAYPEYSWLSTASQTLLTLGAALGLVGVADKVEKSGSVDKNAALAAGLGDSQAEQAGK